MYKMHIPAQGSAFKKKMSNFQAINLTHPHAPTLGAKEYAMHTYCMYNYTYLHTHVLGMKYCTRCLWDKPVAMETKLACGVTKMHRVTYICMQAIVRCWFTERHSLTKYINENSIKYKHFD